MSARTIDRARPPQTPSRIALPELPGTINRLDGESLTHVITYDGAHREFKGREFRVEVAPCDGKGVEIYVSPIPPYETRADISEIVRARFGHDKVPKYK